MTVEHGHALHVGVLDAHHRDPFDRVLIAQAAVERLPILTTDRIFERHGIEVLYAGE